MQKAAKKIAPKFESKIGFNQTRKLAKTISLHTLYNDTMIYTMTIRIVLAMM